MYKANQNFKMAGRMVKRGDEFSSIDRAYITRGLVREVKVIKPETPVLDGALNDIEQPKPARRGRKPKAKTELDQQQD